MVKYMIKHEIFKNLPHNEVFEEPQSNKTVWLSQLCPAFEIPPTQILTPIECCLYCRYSDFEKRPIPCEKAKCCYPKVQTRS